MNVDMAAVTAAINRLVAVLVQGAGLVMLVFIAWKLLGILFSGGSEGAVRKAVGAVLVAGIALAALNDLQQTTLIVRGVGALVWTLIAQAIRAVSVPA